VVEFLASPNDLVEFGGIGIAVRGGGGVASEYRYFGSTVMVVESAAVWLPLGTLAFPKLTSYVVALFLADGVETRDALDECRQLTC
jgi:hypothetical protein